MKKSQRKPSSADVARSLQQLNWLFGKRSAENESAAGKSGEIGTTEIKLRTNDTTKNGGAI